MPKSNKYQYILNYFLLLVFSIILGYFVLKDVRNLDQIIVLDDEFGYWGNAASLARKDWSTLLGYTAYYSYGYSLFLVPLFWLVKTPSTMYSAAIVLNYIFLLVSFIASIYLVNKLLNQKKLKWENICIAFVTTIYVSNLMQSQCAWSENLLYMLVVLLSCFLYKFIENPTIYTGIAVAGIGVYSYMVHQRCLVLIIALLIICILLFAKKAERKKPLLFLIFGIAIFILCASFIKTFVMDYYDGSIYADINNYSGQVGKVAKIFTLNGIMQYLRNAVGSVFYLSISSYCIIPLGLIYCIQQIIKSIHKKKNTFIMYSFWMLIFGGAVALSAIFIDTPTRIDMVFYGRYVDYIAAPFLIMGFLALRDFTHWIWKCLGIITANICMAIVVQIDFQLFDISTYNSFCSCGLSRYLFDSPKKETILPTMVLTTTIVFLSVYLFHMILNCQNHIGVISIFIFIFLGISQYQKYNIYIIQRLQNEMRQDVKPLAGAIEYLNTDLDIYLIYDDLHGKEIENRERYNNKIKYLQFLLSDKTIRQCGYSNLDTIETGHLLIDSESLLLKNAMSLFRLDESTELFYLFTK